MSDTALEMQKALLEKLLNASGKKLGGSKLTLPRHLQPADGSGDSARSAALDALVRGSTSPPRSQAVA